MRISDWSSDVCSSDLSADEGAARHPGDVVIRLPACEQAEQDKEAYARASRVLHRESNPGNARPLVQRHGDRDLRSEEHTSELQSLMRISYAVFCLKNKK